MKSTRYTILIMVFCVVICSVSCADTSENPQESTPAANSTEKGIVLDLSAMKYNSDTDAQPNFMNSCVAKSEHGYYFWTPSATFPAMMFYDIQTKRVVPLCNRPNCDHLNKDCGAYYRGIFEPGEGDSFDVGNYVQFYDGSLYVIGCDTEDYVNLYKVSEDGNSRERNTRLYKADFSASDGSASKDYQEWTSPEVCIHRGYVYFIDPRESIPKLRRIKMGGSDSEVVYETNGSQPKVYRMEAYGDYLFFQTVNYTKENQKPEGGMYVYDLNTGEVRLVKKGVIATYQIADYTLYYYFNNSIWSCSLLTWEESVLVKEALNMDFSTDGKYLYIFDSESGTLEVYDNKGILVASVVDKNLTGRYFGCDLQYLFATGSTAEVQHGTASKEVTTGPVKIEDLMAEDKSFIGIMNLSELQAGNGKWDYLYYSKYQAAD